MITALLAASTLFLAAASDEEALLGVLDDFFVALERADAEAFRAMIEPETQLLALMPGEEGIPRTKLESLEPWLESLEERQGKIVELYWDPVISLSPVGLAHVWAPYYIEYEGKPIHCGVDAFTFVKRDTGWKITNLHDTRDPRGCDRLGLQNAKDRMRPLLLKAKLKSLKD